MSPKVKLATRADLNFPTSISGIASTYSFDMSEWASTTPSITYSNNTGTSPAITYRGSSATRVIFDEMQEDYSEASWMYKFSELAELVTTLINKPSNDAAYESLVKFLKDKYK